MFWDENIYTENIAKFLTKMPKWIAEGKIKSRYTVFQGIDQAEKAFLSMFTGGSFGKTVLKISDE